MCPIPEPSAFATSEEEFYLAGQCVPAGKYQEIESLRIVELHGEDVLPASLDGRVAYYKLVPSVR
jgi:hypothetical protein